MRHPVDPYCSFDLVTQLRALSAIRLSVRTDATTSPERQRDANRTAAERRGMVIIGEAEDLDVSATKTSPFDRPDLGVWFRDRADDFDAVIWWRLDRAVRSMADMNELVKWAREHGKRLVFAEGAMDFDFSVPNPMTDMIATMMAFAAQMEATAIRERVTGAMAALRTQGRYSGGLPPYGYQKVKNPDGAGFKLAPDPEAVAVITRIIRDVLDGASLQSISIKLNEEGIPVPRDYAKIRAGKPTGGMRGGRHHERFMWTSGTLSKVLRTPALMGHRIHQGKTVRDAEGAPVMIGDPVLTRDEFDALQDALNVRTPHEKRTRSDTTALLLGVAKCAGCGGNLYRAVRANGLADYVCRASARGIRCEAPAGSPSTPPECLPSRDDHASGGVGYAIEEGQGVAENDRKGEGGDPVSGPFHTVSFSNPDSVRVVISMSHPRAH
ncbi:recombinase family protein [Actinacidiphila sp. bgisy160]|uniref:recombinase family protein n=1 Tax=Actinacidiphila sp. bgisy160 TaxID=3413796 RepID=UPI003D7624B2